MSEHTNLAKEYYNIVKKNPKTNMTWDKFFDKFRILKEQRTDFAVGCILNQYNRLCGGTFIR